jgi:quercetin dioxygenase-like cupin family protein
MTKSQPKHFYLNAGDGSLKDIKRETAMKVPTAITSPVLAAAAVSVVGVLAFAEDAQQTALKRATLKSGDFPPGYETVMVIAEMEPGNCSGWHTHPGLESSYFLEGEVLMKFAGKPDLVVKAGQPVLIPPGLVHNDCNVSGKPFKALAHYIVEKGKPLASPAAAP